MFGEIFKTIAAKVEEEFCDEKLNPLPHMPIFGSSNSTANKDMISDIWTNRDTIILLSRQHSRKRRNCSL